MFDLTQSGRLFRFSLIAILGFCLVALTAPGPAKAQASGQYSPEEIIDAGHSFFGATSNGLATLLERAFQTYGLPNGYILGEDASGALIGGVTYGEGVLHTRNAGSHQVFWQGPSIGWDFGGDGSRIMMLVYDLPDVERVYGRFGGVSGSAYLVAGAGMRLLHNHGVSLVPVRTGVGARLGVNVGYLKLTRNATWNPF